ncbi:TldD/PmbA family protein [Pseudomonas sp. R5(2019)]|uniref:TldD/PmbA family protein n=1 Tax=Pseudomonas sp. R5(2019) TaxID=2697566 RepID=UPI00141306DD|nr:metallopeptidase TldD-related protein [Pseudomonas sp. R5(2019)]NBA96672.1 TldD/PmbA family protein [Pseudomonas sp. R5(2019)]
MSHPVNRIETFQALVDGLRIAIRAPEQFTFSYNAEDSTFIRFNHARVRQAGQVCQAVAVLKLINDGRQADLQLTLSGEPQVDQQRLVDALAQLREILPLVPADPYLQLNTEPWQRSTVQDHPLPESAAVVERIAAIAGDTDLVGIYAAGPVSRGFASSCGAFGWHQANSFNLDWSLFHANGQAIKANYAGLEWDDARFEQRLLQTHEQLAFLGRPLKALEPGHYRAYLAPAALDEIIGMLGWGGFSAQSIATKSSPLQRLYAGDNALSPQVSMAEQVTGSLSPAFSSEGFVRADLTLIDAGKARDRLVSSRSAAEYQRAGNGADAYESPSALSMAGGDLPLAQVLQRLGTGLYISNLWYLNYSDQPAARMTGMTRFATFWVEDGEINAPVNTMRFDDSVYSLLGTQLEALTVERELILSTSTYGERQTSSTHLPGALLSRLTLTL